MSALFKILSFPLSLEKHSKFLVLSFPSNTSIHKWCFRPLTLWKGIFSTCLHAIKSTESYPNKSTICLDFQISPNIFNFPQNVWECQQVSIGKYFEYNIDKQLTYLPFSYCFLSNTVSPKSLIVLFFQMPSKYN